MRVAGVEDIERGSRSGKPSVMFHLAGVGCFAETADPLRNLDLLYALGVRMSQLTYIQDNGLCCSYLQEHDTGLTPLGKQVVRRMNELGIMVDLAHSGEQSSFDIIEASTEPVMISHTGCRAIYDDSTNRGYLEKVFAQPYASGLTQPSKPGSRNASDESLRTVAEKGGLRRDVLHRLHARNRPGILPHLAPPSGARNWRCRYRSRCHWHGSNLLSRLATRPAGLDELALLDRRVSLQGAFGCRNPKDNRRQLPAPRPACA